MPVQPLEILMSILESMIYLNQSNPPSSDVISHSHLP